jgi:1-acyl-sn-glycerol-3-phosphate acyltransferase
VSWAPKSDLPPAGYRYGPRFKPSRRNVLRGIAYIIRGGRRSLASDTRYALADVPIPLQVRGDDLLPPSGPFVVVANHYERPGLWMAWSAMFAGYAVLNRTAQEVHWVAIQEWESYRLLGVPVPRRVIRAVFERAFRVYGIIAMAPPDASPSARASSIREVARFVRAGMVVGLMPEGTVGTTPELLPAQEGVGTFLLLLSGTGAPIVPVGLYEDEDGLVVRFGAPFRLEVPGDLPRDRRDDWARGRVMLAIRQLLPAPLWGAFAEKE